jgi:hypothetical protein
MCKERGHFILFLRSKQVKAQVLTDLPGEQTPEVVLLGICAAVLFYS